MTMTTTNNNDDLEKNNDDLEKNFSNKDDGVVVVADDVDDYDGKKDTGGTGSGSGYTTRNSIFSTDGWHLSESCCCCWASKCNFYNYKSYQCINGLFSLYSVNGLFCILVV